MLSQTGLVDAWLVGQESDDGYKIILLDVERGFGFGPAVTGWESDPFLVLVGVYGDHLLDAINAM